MNIGICSIPASPVSQTGSSLVPAPQLDISRYARTDTRRFANDVLFLSTIITRYPGHQVLLRVSLSSRLARSSRRSSLQATSLDKNFLRNLNYSESSTEKLAEIFAWKIVQKLCMKKLIEKLVNKCNAERWSNISVIHINHGTISWLLIFINRRATWTLHHAGYIHNKAATIRDQPQDLGGPALKK
jgi:hypothetical protein